MNQETFPPRRNQTIRRFAVQLWKSVTSVKFYQELAGRPFSEGIKYFSFLIFLVALLFTLRLTLDLSRNLKAFERWSKDHLPEIVVEKGKVTVDVPQPWRFEGEHFVVVIDTRGGSREIGESYAQGVLITKDKLILKRGPLMERRFDLSEIESLRVTPETIHNWRTLILWISPPLLVCILFFYFWVGKFIQVILFSTLSLLANGIGRKGLSYETLFIIGLYALSAPLLLLSFFILLGFGIHSFDMVYLAIYGALLVTTVLQYPPRKKLEEQLP
ncbi:MAG: DUF1189 family protein [Candidatus Omnitrophota bacterium]